MSSRHNRIGGVTRADSGRRRAYVAEGGLANPAVFPWPNVFRPRRDPGVPSPGPGNRLVEEITLDPEQPVENATGNEEHQRMPNGRGFHRVPTVDHQESWVNLASDGRQPELVYIPDDIRPIQRPIYPLTRRLAELEMRLDASDETRCGGKVPLDPRAGE